MAYIIAYTFDNNPEEIFEVDSLLATDDELKLEIQKHRDADLIAMNTTKEEWNKNHARLIRIVSVKPSKG